MTFSNWLALGAFLISCIALVISIYELMNNKPKLRVTLGNGITIGPNYIYVEIINYGRQPTTIDSISFSHKTLTGNLWAQAVSEISSEKNKFLTPGEKAIYYYNADDALDYQNQKISFFKAVNELKFYAQVKDTWSGNFTRNTIKTNRLRKNRDD